MSGVRYHISAVRNRKAWLRIIEIALAATLVFSFTIFLTRFEGGAKISGASSEKYQLGQLGQDALRAYDLVDSDSDHVTDLRWEILTADWASIGTYLNETLGRQVGYSLYFYPATGGYSRGNVQFKTGRSVSPASREISSVYYIIAGDEGRFCSAPNACALKLDLWYIK